jgi:hypothetical protein
MTALSSKSVLLFGGQWVERHSFNKAMQSMLQREQGIEEVSHHLTGREADLVKMVVEGFRTI